MDLSIPCGTHPVCGSGRIDQEKSMLLRRSILDWVMADGFPSRSSTYCLRWVITHLPRRGFSWHLAGILHCRGEKKVSAPFGNRVYAQRRRTYVTLLNAPLTENSELGLPSRILSVIALCGKSGLAEHHRLPTLLGLGIRYRGVRGVKFAYRHIRCVAIQE